MGSGAPVWKVKVGMRLRTRDRQLHTSLLGGKTLRKRGKSAGAETLREQQVALRNRKTAVSGGETEARATVLHKTPSLSYT